jgi:hypothetical protein
MPSKRLNLGATPHLIIERCGGNLDVRGWDRDETLIETSGMETTIVPEETGAVLATEDNCAIRLPDGGSFSISLLDGDLRVKDIRGAVSASQVGGSASIRRAGPVTLGSVDGQFSAREVQSLNTERIGGHASIRDISDPISIGAVGGSLAGRDIPGGLHLEHVGGNVEIRTDCRPETQYRFQAGGSVEFSVPGNADVRFLVNAAGAVRADNAFQRVDEGKQAIFTLGGGSAIVEIQAGGSIRLRQRGYYGPDDQEFPLDMDAFSEQFEDAFGQLDIQFGNIEKQMDLIPPQVRGHVSRKLDAARRRMHDAQKRVVQTMQSAQRDFNIEDWSGVTADLTRGRSRSEPVSEQERLMILQMLEDGKISVTEAQKLLDALEGRGH